MAYPKGKPRPEGAGRKKGTPNASTLPLEAKAKELGIDPFHALLLFAKGDWESLGYVSEKYISGANEYGTWEKWTIDPGVRCKAAQDACTYLYSRRQAISVDLSADPEMLEAVKSLAGLPKEELLKIIAAEMRKLK